MSRRSAPVEAPDLEELLRLYVDGWSEEELGDLIGVHPARIPAILEDAMSELRARCRVLVATPIRQLLEFLDSFIEENVRIVVTRCPACDGDEQARISCRKCRWPDTAYGPTGYAYPPTRRSAAIGRISSLAWRRIKLLGLDKLPPSSTTEGARHPKPSGPIAEYLEQSLAKKLPGVEVEDEWAGSLAEFALDRELILTSAVMREAAHFIQRKCVACGGNESRRVECDTCDRTGYFYPPHTRLEAMSRQGNMQDQRIRLLGLHKQPLQPPHQRASAPDSVVFFQWLEHASDGELEAEVEKVRHWWASNANLPSKTVGSLSS